MKYDLYIRMDYLTSIGQLYLDSKLTIKNLLTMGVDICDALDWCHKNGRVHNNLNLNMLVKRHQKPPLCVEMHMVLCYLSMKHIRCIAEMVIAQLIMDEKPLTH